MKELELFFPAMCTQRVGDVTDAPIVFPVVKSPKSCAFPVDAMVIKSITLVAVIEFILQ